VLFKGTQAPPALAPAAYFLQVELLGSGNIAPFSCNCEEFGREIYPRHLRTSFARRDRGISCSRRKIEYPFSRPNFDPHRLLGRYR
jgi:hypothetical protein